MSDFLRIKIIGDKDSHKTAALFSSSGVPNDANYSLERDDSGKQTKLNATDLICDQKYSGLPDRNSGYYIGVRNRDVLEIHSLSMYRMNPIIDLDEMSANLTPLTTKEQMDEIKAKFGSRKTQRSLASKRKYAIEFGEEDVQQVDSKTKLIEENIQSANETTINESLDILPKQNRDAISVEEVYDLNEIITEYERNVLKQYESELFGQISDLFIRQLICDQQNDSEKKLIAIYINLIINVLSLKANDLRKADPLPLIPSDVKELFFERYLNTQVVAGKAKYVLNAKQKDRLLIYGIILSLIVYNYRPIDMELLQKTFKVPLKQLRKIVEIIGAYVENFKNSSGVNTKAIVLRVPLNTFSETKKSYKRR